MSAVGDAFIVLGAILCLVAFVCLALPRSMDRMQRSVHDKLFRMNPTRLRMHPFRFRLRTLL